MARMKMRVKGVYALLTHNPASMAVNAAANSKPKRGAKEIPTPEVEAESGLYLTEDGAYAIPGMAFRNSILKAAADWRSPIRKRQSLQNDLATLMVEQDLVPLIDDDGNPIKSYEIDTRRALVQGQGILRSRPKFREWGAEFTFEVDDQAFGNAVDQILDSIPLVAADAGKRVGVGDYRPQKVKGLPGPFGRYAVVSVTPLADGE